MDNGIQNQLFFLNLENEHNTCNWLQGERIEYLPSENESFSPNWRVYLLFKPGASIERLSHEAQLLIQSSSDKTAPYHVVFMGGICNLTEKFKHQSGTEIVYQHSSHRFKCCFTALKTYFIKFLCPPLPLFNLLPFPLYL